jgi:hypothetical protein
MKAADCAIVRCSKVAVAGHRTCVTSTHRNVEKCYQLHGQSHFQLQDHLTRAKISHPNDAFARDIDNIAELADEPNVDEDFHLDEQGGAYPAITADNTHAVPRKKIKARFGRQRTHNKQLIVAPCGLIIACQTFFGAEGVASVVICAQSYYPALY